MNSTSTLVGLHRRTQETKSNPPTVPPSQKTNTSLVDQIRNVSRKHGLTWRWASMSIAAAVISTYAFVFIFYEPPAEIGGYPALRNRVLKNPLGVGHVFGGGTAMALGPFQYIRSLRSRGKTSPRFSTHSWVGRVYMLAVLISGVGSVDIIKNSEMYDFGKAGFITLGLSWLVTGALGWAAMWRDKPDIEGHRRWMMRNFALTYAAVMIRWQLPVMMKMGMELEFGLSCQGWMSWVPNVIFVDLWLLRKRT